MDTNYYKSQLKNFLDVHDRLTQFPVKYKLKIFCLFYLADKFEPEKQYTENEVNELLDRWHTFNDYCILRRELYNKRFLGRELNGSKYWLEIKQPILEDFNLGI